MLSLRELKFKLKIVFTVESVNQSAEFNYYTSDQDFFHYKTNLSFTSQRRGTGGNIPYYFCYIFNVQSSITFCWCSVSKVTGHLEDCACDVETIDGYNNDQLFPKLQSLLESDYFRFYKVRRICGCTHTHKQTNEHFGC